MQEFKIGEMVIGVNEQMMVYLANRYTQWQMSLGHEKPQAYHSMQDGTKVMVSTFEAFVVGYLVCDIDQQMRKVQHIA